MLVVTKASAYPVNKEEKVPVDKNLIKAFMYLWNEKMGNNQHAVETQNPWNGEEGDKERERGKMEI